MSNNRLKVLRDYGLQLTCNREGLFIEDVNHAFKQKIYADSYTQIREGLMKLHHDKFLHLDWNSFNRLLNQLKYVECRYCGELFKPKNRSVYCSADCRRSAKRMQDRLNKRRQRAGVVK